MSLRYTIIEAVRLNGEVRPFEQSIPITVAIVVACYLLLLLQTTDRASRWIIPQSALLGLLTYPLYLLHSRLGSMTFNRFANDDNKWAVYAVTFAMIIGLSYAVHVLAERLPKRTWLGLFDALAGTPTRWLEIRMTAGVDRIMASSAWW